MNEHRERATREKVGTASIDSCPEASRTSRPARELAGRVDFAFCEDIGDPDPILLYEEWSTSEAFDAYRGSPMFAASGARVMPMLAEAPKSSYYESENVFDRCAVRRRRHADFRWLSARGPSIVPHAGGIFLSGSCTGKVLMTTAEQRAEPELVIVDLGTIGRAHRCTWRAAHEHSPKPSRGVPHEANA
jgi:quinol monooxygenase YgiN